MDGRKAPEIPAGEGSFDEDFGATFVVYRSPFQRAAARLVNVKRQEPTRDRPRRLFPVVTLTFRFQASLGVEVLLRPISVSASRRLKR
jgi:hypothetical protein